MLINMKEKTADLNKGENAQDVEKCNIKIGQVAQLGTMCAGDAKKGHWECMCQSKAKMEVRDKIPRKAHSDL